MHTRADRVHVLPIRLCVRECVCAPARLCVLRRMRTRVDTCEHSPPAVDRVRLGSQAFQSSSSFSANIGAWNIASVTTLSFVCTAFGRRRAPRRARSVGARCGAALVRDGTADARAHTCVRAYTYSLPRVSTCVHRAARREDGMRQYI